MNITQLSAEHTIPCSHGWPLVCVFWAFWRKMTVILALNCGIDVSDISFRLSDVYIHWQFNHHYFRLWLVTWCPQSHYLNQCWKTTNQTHRNKLQWNFDWNCNIFIQENMFQSVSCEMAAILSWPSQFIHKLAKMKLWILIFHLV